MRRRLIGSLWLTLLFSALTPFWAPVPEPSIQTGVLAMSVAVLELAGKK